MITKWSLTTTLIITASNIEDKEDVNLLDFDINYVVPTYAKVIYEYYINLESSLALTQLKNYDDLRKEDFVFDKYVALNQNKYLDLTASSKYEHVATAAVVTTAFDWKSKYKRIFRHFLN